MPADLLGQVLANAAARRAAPPGGPRPQPRREEPVTAPLAPMASGGPAEADGSEGEAP